MASMRLLLSCKQCQDQSSGTVVWSRAAACNYIYIYIFPTRLETRLSFIPSYFLTVLILYEEVMNRQTLPSSHGGMLRWVLKKSSLQHVGIKQSSATSVY